MRIRSPISNAIAGSQAGGTYVSGVFAILFSSAFYTLPSFAQEKKLEDASFKEIIKSYTIIADFSQHPPEREISTLLFWKYPFHAPMAEFSPDFTLGDGEEMPSTPGSERVIEHLNRGRVLFTQGDYEEARKTWLTARARFGTEYEFHRRTDYFIGLSFMRLAEILRKRFHGNWDEFDVRFTYSNAATFLSWAMVTKKTVRDPLMELVTPKALYTLAAIYYRYKRFAGAHAMAEEGLNFLLETGRTDFRFPFRRLIAETWIRNHSYLQAVQELDTAVRQDPIPQDVAKAFARMGDIFFDLNNYLLSEDMYGLSAAVNRLIGRKDPVSTILRGESFFWLGKLTEARVAFWYGLRELAGLEGGSDYFGKYASWANLRIADTFLAQMQKAKEDKKEALAAKLLADGRTQYFKVLHDFPKTEAAQIAQVRLTCLDLPQYQGQNIKHSREVLSLAKSEDNPRVIREIAWACEVQSFAIREKTPQMVARVSEFANKFPQSQFLKTFLEPVKEVNTSYLDEYLKKGDIYKAIQFYEKKKDDLFPTVTPFQASGLFKAYIDTLQTNKAEPFASAFRIKDYEDRLYETVFVTEMHQETQKKQWATKSRELEKKWNKEKAELPYIEKTDSMIHRILRTPLASHHLTWMTAQIQKWSEEKHDLRCSLLYIALSKRYAAQESKDVSELGKLQDFLDINATQLLQEDKNCAYNFLDIEVKIGQSFRDKYAEQWLKRTEWPLDKIVVERIWAAAETLNELGNTDGATKLWTLLSEKAAPEYPEAKLSRLRLNPDIPDVEKFWGH